MGGYEIGGCFFESHDKIDRLMKEVDFKINTKICPELPSEIAREKHLKSHSEKKALAILLNSNERNIKIKVARKMCADCHNFFCQISKKYNERSIECVDP